MTQNIISAHFEKSRAALKAEYESMSQKIKASLEQSKREALSKI